jgi:phosphate transport system substrate-binding protein
MPATQVQVMRSRFAAPLGLVLAGACALSAGAWQKASARSEADESLIRTEGPRDLLPLASALRNGWREQSEDVEVSLGAGLSDKARLDALASGAIDAAFAGHTLDASDLAARGMTAHKLGVTAVVFAVHADVTLRDLKPEDLCDIYAGRVATWEAYGGPPIPIQPVLRPESDADTEVARAAIPCLKDLTPGRAVVMARTASDMRVALQGTSGAIGLTTLAAVRQSIVALRAVSIAAVSPIPANVSSGRYPLVRPAWLVTKASPSPLVLRFLAFAKSERGAAAIADAGLLPMP